MNDPVTILLVVVVTGVLTGTLVLLFWAGNRLQERLQERRKNLQPPVLAVQDVPVDRGMVESPMEAPSSLSEVLHLAGEGADLGARIQALRILAGLKVPLDADVRQVLERARQEREPALRNAAAWAWCELGRPEDLELVKVPAGEFLMGSFEEDDNGYPLEQPQHLLYLPTFYIGRHLVTVGDFSEFLVVSGTCTRITRSCR
jgi:Sulfatase-modifying factor enzyme 1